MLSALSRQSQCKSLCNLFSRIRLSGQKDRIDIRIVLCCIVGIGKCRRLIDFSLGRGISQLAQNHRAHFAVRRQHFFLLQKVRNDIDILHCHDRRIFRIGNQLLNLAGRIPERRIRQRIRIGVICKSPVDISLGGNHLVHRNQQVTHVIAVLRRQIPVPLLIHRNIDSRIRVHTLDAVVKNAHRVRIFPRIGIQIDVLHIIPIRTDVDLVADNPVHDNPVVIIPVSLRQKRADRCKRLHAICFRCIERIIISRAAPGKRMGELRIRAALII